MHKDRIAILLILDDSGSVGWEKWDGFIEMAKGLVAEEYTGLILSLYSKIPHLLSADGIQAMSPAFGFGVTSNEIRQLATKYPYLQPVLIADKFIEFDHCVNHCIVVDVDTQTIHHQRHTDRNDSLVDTLAALLPCPVLPKSG